MAEHYDGNGHDSGVVYAGLCSSELCGKIYIGQTRREFHLRFNEHRTRGKPKPSSLTKHVTASNDCIFDTQLKIYLMAKNLGKDKLVLKKREKELIEQLLTQMQKVCSAVHEEGERCRAHQRLPG